MIFKILFTSYQAIVMRLAIDLNLFDVVLQRTDADATNATDRVTVNQVACDTKAENAFVARIMRFLSSMGMLKQLSRDTFTRTSLTESFCSNTFLSQAIIHYTHLQTFITALPEYFKATDYKNPSYESSAPFQFVLNPTFSHYSLYLANNPYYQNATSTALTPFWSLFNTPWFEIYPIDRIRNSPPSPFNRTLWPALISHPSKKPMPPPLPRSKILLVDIGGDGQTLQALHARYPHLPGPLVLQHPPNTLVPSLQGIRTYTYNYFAPQPIKGARVYVLNNILHEWADDRIFGILEQVKNAMRNESVLLVVEKVIPDKDVGLMDLVQDWSEMVCYARRERTEGEFREILRRVGFRVGVAWKGDAGVDARLGISTGMRMMVLEAKLAGAGKFRWELDSVAFVGDLIYSIP
ncbi:S-adenosyl-L-methionine-dependent methyltransferase [Aspergillus ibericus CBS 121593]|uniref:S-adenosyl-L-methionine-dependent methyltransferase n=1 Tax=Aspergillus ibericus CBS 121593 TaxID=1448316 RepID=A0A395GQV2_9EURO|nr:S-adenosyl-L-methionine-dependent methyltransferase [Aspergillus ibericus CBS 121593]RAK97328.1 S-adenosyl-L-methionine-dependent methyltransferase [Aspergillus ibericus CBS 121593]